MVLLRLKGTSGYTLYTLELEEKTVVRLFDLLQRAVRGGLVK